MKIIILSAAGFIGTNLSLKLMQNSNDEVTVVDEKNEYFASEVIGGNVKIVETKIDKDTDFDELVKGQEIVYHLFSSIVPTTSNRHIEHEIDTNVITTIRLLEACVRCNIKRVVFISSGGTVYGNNVQCPIDEDSATNPINSYGIQKLTIEKLLHLYYHIHNLDYRVIRLSNPYGPYQRPNGILGAVTTFTYQMLNNEMITIYGDGAVIRDYIYIEDAINAIINISGEQAAYKVYNVGSGKGISLNELIREIEKTLEINAKIRYSEGRKSDVMVNFLNITRYEGEYGDLSITSINEGIVKTAKFLESLNNR